MSYDSSIAFQPSWWLKNNLVFRIVHLLSPRHFIISSAFILLFSNSSVNASDSIALPKESRLLDQVHESVSRFSHHSTLNRTDRYPQFLIPLDDDFPFAPPNLNWKFLPKVASSDPEGEFLLTQNLAFETVDTKKQARQELRKLAISFFDYEDKYGYFPAVDSSGDPKSARGKGLSWRVHLLPFLGQKELFEKFNLTEPWDSEHNKKLITQMPAIYGKNPKGKTPVHVFLGENTAFQMEKPGRKYKEFTDSRALTILVAVTGTDKSDFWTKPGGVKFASKDPIAELGNIGDEVLIILADGARKYIRTDLLKQALPAIIQINDGNSQKKLFEEIWYQLNE